MSSHQNQLSSTQSCDDHDSEEERETQEESLLYGSPFYQEMFDWMLGLGHEYRVTACQISYARKVPLPEVSSKDVHKVLEIKSRWLKDEGWVLKECDREGEIGLDRDTCERYFQNGGDNISGMFRRSNETLDQILEKLINQAIDNNTDD